VASRITGPTGREIEAAFMARLWDERKHQPVTIRCAVAGCAFQVEGQLGDVSTAHLEHRKSEHPDIKPKHRKHQKNGRIGGVVTKVSLDENVANVRAQGGATWA
jgi:hypothetical protein